MNDVSTKVMLDMGRVFWTVDAVDVAAIYLTLELREGREIADVVGTSGSCKRRGLSKSRTRGVWTAEKQVSKRVPVRYLSICSVMPPPPPQRTLPKGESRDRRNLATEEPHHSLGRGTAPCAYAR